MGGSARTSTVPAVKEVAGAFAMSAGVFVITAAAIPLRDDAIPVVLWGVIWLAVVLVGGRRWGPLYGVPLAITVAVAFDYYYIPPPRALDFKRHWENYLTLLMYLVLAVLVGVIAEASRRERDRLGREQAALRRVATLVARRVDSQDVFAAAANEMRDLLGVDMAMIVRFEADATMTIIAETGGRLKPGERFPVRPPLALDEVRRTGATARANSYRDLPSEMRADFDRLGGVQATVASPLQVDGRVWGAIAISSFSGALPADVEALTLEYTELLSTAIANADSRNELIASRARIIAASDDTRRRIERDLHDGLQQRLVSLSLALRRASRRVPADLPELAASLEQTGEDLKDATQQLREISRGIHPASLSQGGLAPALRTLARRAPLPVTVAVAREERLPEHVEIAAYYIVAEALTNVGKHAQASTAQVKVSTVQEALCLQVCDDGVGGADPSRGSGLIGLGDRVAALGGTIAVHSPPGDGTRVEVTLPLGVADGRGAPGA